LDIELGLGAVSQAIAMEYETKQAAKIQGGFTEYESSGL
jgi:hypothetical protein